MGVINQKRIMDDFVLEYHLDEKEMFNNSVLGMLQNNSIQGIVPFNKFQMNDQRILQYKSVNGQSVQTILQTTVDREIVLNILKELANIVYRLKEYMIEDSYVLWDMNYIFYSKDKEISVFCVPTKRNETDSFQTFCDIFLDEIPTELFKPSEIDQLKGYLDQKIFDPREFYEILDKVDINSLVVSKNKMIGGQHVVLTGRSIENSDKNNKVVILDSSMRRKNDSEATSPIILTKTNIEDAVLKEIVNEETVIKPIQKEPSDLIEEMDKDDNTVVILPVDDSDKTVLMDFSPITGTLVRVKTNQEYSITEDENTIGRSQNGNTVIISENVHIGRHHACIRRDMDYFVLVDLNSKNKSYLNGEMIEPGKEYDLKDGDEIRLADETFQFYVN